MQRAFSDDPSAFDSRALTLVQCYDNGSKMVYVIILVLFIYLIMISSPCSGYISDFFTPPEDEILKGMGEVSQQMVSNSNDNNEKDALSTFDNDLPNQTTPIPTDSHNYNETVAQMALEKNVFDQHNNYAKQREKYTGTASFNPERSDSQDIVPFVGLRRPSYLTPKGDSLVDSTARQVPSIVDPKTLSKPVNLSWDYGKF